METLGTVQEVFTLSLGDLSKEFKRAFVTFATEKVIKRDLRPFSRSHSQRKLCSMRSDV
jgi:hypothetical protein